MTIEVEKIISLHIELLRKNSELQDAQTTILRCERNLESKETRIRLLEKLISNTFNTG